MAGWMRIFLIIIIFHPNSLSPYQVPSLCNGNVSSHTGNKVHPLRGLTVRMLTPSKVGMRFLWGTSPSQPSLGWWCSYFPADTSPSRFPSACDTRDRARHHSDSPVPEPSRVPQKCPASPGFAPSREHPSSPCSFQQVQFRDLHAVEGTSLLEDYRGERLPCSFQLRGAHDKLSTIPACWSTEIPDKPQILVRTSWLAAREWHIS